MSEDITKSLVELILKIDKKLTKIESRLAKLEGMPRESVVQARATEIKSAGEALLSLLKKGEWKSNKTLREQYGL